MIIQKNSNIPLLYFDDQVKEISKEDFQKAEVKAKELGTTQLIIALTHYSPKLISPKLIASLLKNGADPKIAGKVKIVETTEAGKSDVELCCPVYYKLAQFSQFKSTVMKLTPLEIVGKQITLLKAVHSTASIYIERLNTVAALLKGEITPENILKA